MWTQAYFQRSTRETLMPFPSFDWWFSRSLCLSSRWGCWLRLCLVAELRGSVFWFWDKTVWCVCRHANLLQSCPTLWDFMDYSPLGSSVHGISQARILKWVATSSSRGSSWSRDQTQVSSIANKFFSIWTTMEGQRAITQERMKFPGQRRNDTQLWMCLLVKVKSDTVKNNIA